LCGVAIANTNCIGMITAVIILLNDGVVTMATMTRFVETAAVRVVRYGTINHPNDDKLVYTKYRLYTGNSKRLAWPVTFVGRHSTVYIHIAANISQYTCIEYSDYYRGKSSTLWRTVHYWPDRSQGARFLACRCYVSPCICN